MQAQPNNLPPRKCSSLTSAALLLGISVEILQDFLPTMRLKHYEREEQIKKETKNNPKSI
jgi:hypothetical protein